MKKILVLGSNSFAGSVFVDECLNANMNVVGVNRSSEQHPAFLPVKANSRIADYDFYQMNINEDQDALQTLIASFKPNVVVDYAAQSMVAESWDNPDHWYLTNIVAKAKLTKFLMKADYLDQFIRISTPEVYGSTSEIITETQPYSPSTPYAISQMATDTSLMAFHENLGFPVTITRAANYYGPGQQLYRIVPKTILSILKGTKLNLHGGGKSVRAFIHAKDSADGVIKIINQNKIGEIFQFSTDEFVSIRELVELICKKLNIDFNIAVEIGEDRIGKDQAYLMSSKKAKEVLDWNPKIDLSSGIDETIAWINNNLDALNTMPLEYQHKA
jgi:dTDP-glucose 4,6-dehydratase